MIVQSAARIMHDNILVGTHSLEAARVNEIGRYLYTSSAFFGLLRPPSTRWCAGNLGQAGSALGSLHDPAPVRVS